MTLIGLLLVATAIGQVCTTKTYEANSSATVNYSLSFPGNPSCGAGAVTNNLSWNIATSGQAICPQFFNFDTVQWEYVTKITSDFGGGGNAGCWYFGGPGVFASGTQDCSGNDVACAEVYVTVLGQFIGIAPVGTYLAGATYFFGQTSCFPASASQEATTCTTGGGAACATDSCGNSCGIPQADGSCNTSNCPCSIQASGGGACWTDSCGNACGTQQNNGTCDHSGCNTCACQMGGACGTCGTLDCNGNCNDSCSGGGGGGGGDPCGGCASGASCVDNWGTYECIWNTDPILIDLSGNGFLMTDLKNGVNFDFFGTGTPLRVSWTQANAQDGWLALDLNHDGKIDNGQELFGNAMPSPGPAGTRLGFKALAVYDTKKYGGNGDGVIDAKDAIYNRLRIWVDKNHNGVTDAGELITLAQAGIKSISVNYQQLPYTDVYGNQFRYRAQVTWTNPKAKSGQQWAYDIVLVSSISKLDGDK